MERVTSGNRAKYEKICVMCGRPFKSKMPHALTDSNKCRKRLQRDGRPLILRVQNDAYPPIVPDPRNKTVRPGKKAAIEVQKDVISDILQNIGKPVEEAVKAKPGRIKPLEARGGVLKPFKAKKPTKAKKPAKRKLKQLRPRKRA